MSNIGTELAYFGDINIVAKLINCILVILEGREMLYVILLLS